jgi:hypothetical protein
MLVLPHLNGELLGDKIVLSAVVAGLKQRSAVPILGVEGHEPLGMASYATPPEFLIKGDISTILPCILASNTKALVCLFRDHNSVDIESCVNRNRVRVSSLWDELKSLSQKSIYPRLSVPFRWLSEADNLLSSLEAGRDSRFAVLHVRCLSRQRWKNSDLEMMCRIAVEIAKELDIYVLVVGKRDRRRRILGRRVIDLGFSDLTIGQTAGLLARAKFFVGGDSGPIHLASAVGCPVVGIGYTTERHGPFTPQWQTLGLFGPEKRGNIRGLSSPDQVLSVVPEFLLARPASWPVNLVAENQMRGSTS